MKTFKRYFSIKLFIFFIALFTIFLIIFSKRSSSKQKKSEVDKPNAITQLPLSLDLVFSKKHPIISPDEVITLVATGDVIPARSVNSTVTRLGNYKYPYEKTKELLQNKDLLLINLESPLIDNCPITEEGFTFCGNSKNIEGLEFAKVDIANLSNNHIGNYGKEGLENTKQLLIREDIIFTGIDGPVYKTTKGIKLAFLGYSEFGSMGYLVSSAEPKKISNEIKEAKNNSDIVVVSFHWGNEYTSQPSPKQIELAHLAIDSGADLIIGNHPHWIQPVEIYKNGFITYAHGNFIFDQMWSEKTKQGVVGKYVFYNKQLVDVSFTPIHIKDYSQPQILTGNEAERVLIDMEIQSKILNKNLQENMLK